MNYLKNRKPRDQDLGLLKYAAMVGSDQISVGSKIKKLINRNHQLNAHLYELDEGLDGTDYVTCPVLGTRMLIIRDQYITNILNLSLEEFRLRYPNAKTRCDGHAQNIAKGLLEPTTNGLTKHEESVLKATQTRAQIGEDGLSGNARKGAKTRATHMQRDENGLNGYQKIAFLRNTTLLENGMSVQQNGLLKRFSTMAASESSDRRASKISKKVLRPLLDYLKEHHEKHYFDESEFGINTTHGCFYYDLVIPSQSICIEYQSNRFHPNPFWNDVKWTTWFNPFDLSMKPEEKLQYDLLKAKLLWEHRRISTWFVWEDTADEDVEHVSSYLRDSINVI